MALECSSPPSDTLRSELCTGAPCIGLLYMCVVPGSSAVKNLLANADGMGLIPGSGRSPGEGNGYLPNILAWKIPMDRGVWQVAVHGGHKRLR